MIMFVISFALVTFCAFVIPSVFIVMLIKHVIVWLLWYNPVSLRFWVLGVLFWVFSLFSFGVFGVLILAN